MKKNLVFPALSAIFFLLLIRFAAFTADAIRQGLQLAFGTAIPALFPFFIASALMTQSGLAALLGRFFSRPMHWLYGVNGCGAAALILGLTGGYPVGAQTICSLYHSGQLNKSESEQLLGFCNNTGPAFILGVVGIGVCGSARTGMELYGIHAVSAILVGLLLPRRKKTSHTSNPVPKTTLTPLHAFPACFVSAVRDAFQTSILVAAFIATAALFLSLLHNTGIFSAFISITQPILNFFGISDLTANAALSGTVELTNGLLLLPNCLLPKSQLLPICSFLLGFGSLSVHCQTLSLTQPLKLSCHLHFWGKLLHGILAAVLTHIVMLLSPHTFPVFSVCMPVHFSNQIGTIFSWLILGISIVVVLLTFNGGKYRRNGL